MMMGVLWQAATARGRHHRGGRREEEEVEDWGRRWRSSGGTATGQGWGFSYSLPLCPMGQAHHYRNNKEAWKEGSYIAMFIIDYRTTAYTKQQQYIIIPVLFVYDRKLKGFPQNGETCGDHNNSNPCLTVTANTTHPRFKADRAVFHAISQSLRVEV